MRSPALKGSALILVLWTVSSLSLFAAVLGSQSIFGLELARNLEHRLQARYIALAGLQHALGVLEDDLTPGSDGLGESWRNEELLFRRKPFGAGYFDIHYPGKDPETGAPKEFYGFLDEDAKINLNTASSDLLHGLLAQVEGLTEDKRQEIVDSILDWRDEDQNKSPYGAENFYYLGLDPAYGCKDGAFENTEELLFVRGMTPAIFSWVAPHVTVYGSGKVNLNTADEAVLRALGLSSSGVSGIVFYRAGEDNKEGTGDDRMFSSAGSAMAELSSVIPAEDISRLMQLDQEQLISASSKAFRISVTAHAEEDLQSQIKIHCVVDRKGRVLAWQEE